MRNIVIDCTLKHNVESVFPFISGTSEEFPEGILKHMLSPDMYSQVLSPHSLVQPLQFLSEVPPLHIKVQDTGVVDQYREWSVRQGGGGLTQNLVQNCPMGL